MSAVSYAQRLYQFPLGVFGIAVATAIFPALARAAGDGASFVNTLRRGLRLVIFIGLPASVGLMLVRGPLAAVIFQGGDFTAADTERVARVLLGYAPAIWAYSMTHTLTRAFYADEDSMTPVRIAVGVVALNVVLNCTLIWTPLREAGLAWSTAICAVVQVAFLAHVLRRRHGGLVDRPTLGSWGRSILATAVMAACVLGVDRAMGPGDTWAATAGVLAALVGAGLAAYLALARILRMAEPGWILGRE
jgi:putative peptidoglycan lipid II flippase